MPYIYSLARMVSEDGKPMMRAMCYEFKDDENAAGYEHQYMFGPSILVSPVVEKGRRYQDVYLPEGEWYDFWTDGKYEGGKSYKVPAPLDRIPLFIKAGSMIPMCKQADSVENIDDDIILHIYDGGGIDSEFTLYEDDATTFDYEKGVYAKTLFECLGDSYLKVYPQEGVFKVNESRDYTIVYHGVSKSSYVKINGRDAENMAYDENKRILNIQTGEIKRKSGFSLKFNAEESFIPADDKFEVNDVYLDADTLNNGITTIRAGFVGSESFKARLNLPAEWLLIEGQKDTACQGDAAKWVIKPYGDAMPVISKMKVDFDITDKNGGTSCIEKGIDIGS